MIRAIAGVRHSPPPTRDGVGPSSTVLSDGSWTTIAECLAEKFPAIGIEQWHKRMEQGEVVDEFGATVTLATPHRANLRVFYYRTIEKEPRIPFDEAIIFQDDHLVVADKPHFLPVIPSGRFLQETLLVRLKKRTEIDTLVPIHRIDSGTAGVVVFSVGESERDAYQSLFRTREVEKVYESIGHVNPSLTFPRTYSSRLVADDHFMRMREVPGDPNSTTHIEMIESRADVSHYRLRPISGRKHQLRVHSAALGIAIVNDPMYPDMLAEPKGEALEDFSRPLQLLAREISFRDPITGDARKFESRRRLDW